MNSQESIQKAGAELKKALQHVQREIREYPSPIAGCDAQYNYLLGMRVSVKEALDTIQSPKFVPTPRELVAGAGMEQR